MIKNNFFKQLSPNLEFSFARYLCFSLNKFYFYFYFWSCWNRHHHRHIIFNLYINNIAIFFIFLLINFYAHCIYSDNIWLFFNIFIFLSDVLYHVSNRITKNLWADNVMDSCKNIKRKRKLKQKKKIWFCMM